MNRITVRGLEIGAGAPKIIVPIVGATREEILVQAKVLSDSVMHMVEWRIDFYEDVFVFDKLLDTLKEMRTILKTPILVTFRTKKEGGQKEINDEQYIALNKAIAQSGDADFIDVEIFSGDAVVSKIIETAHNAGTLVVGSNHDFFSTPNRADIVYRLRKMQDMGADIPKIAVMPTCTEDMLTLLGASAEMAERYADRPIITMSMSAKGVISRLSGEVFGSAMTFGAVGQGSAPGQISADSLAQVLDILHRSV